MGVRHFSHPMHDLVICSKADYEQVPCAACTDMCSGMTYACKPCCFYIHYWCLIPEEFSHPAHPAHPAHPLHLDLHPVPADFTCSACCRSLHNGFRFIRREPCCSFTIDVKCAYPPPAITYPNHRHSLNFFDELPEDVELSRCDACRKPCKSSVLYCLGCKFGVHLLCERPMCMFEHRHGALRLPQSRCPSKDCLELKASIDEEEFPRHLLRLCFYCRKEIGPQTPLYYCKDCKMIAHVKCIFSKAKGRGEVLEMIRAEAKQDGEKQGAKEAATQHVETFGSMVNSLDDKDKAELEGVHKRRVVEIIKVLAWRNSTAGSSDGVPNSPFLDVAFSEFRKKLPHDIPRTNSLTVASEDERLFKVAEYKMTQKLAPVLRELFVTHGDVSEESRLTQNPRIMVFVMLCGTIYSMANTKVAEVTEELLYNWWKYLMFIHLSGFKIQFAIDRLKVVMRAHYTDLQDDNNSILRMDKEIRELSEEIEESKRELQRLKDEREPTSSVTDESLVEARLKNARAWKY